MYFIDIALQYMWRCLAALLLIAARGCLGGILEDYPDKITVCHSLDCARGVADKYTTSGELIVLTVTHSLNYDRYLALYLGWLLEMLEKVPFHMVYFDIARMLLGSEEVALRSADEVYEIVAEYVSSCSACDESAPWRPKPCAHCSRFTELRTVAFSFPARRLAHVIMKGIYRFILYKIRRHSDCTTDAMFQMDLRDYVSIRRAHGLSVPIFIHLNDETPWVSADDWDLDATIRTYASSPLAIRNYYYNKTNAHALYYPLGAGELSFVTKIKANTDVAIKSLKPSNKRTFLCAFAGRTKYKEDTSDGASERAQLMNAMKDPGAEQSLCYTVVSGVKGSVPFHGLDYNKYFNFMKETIFAPCPGGNNPETFRHYEVMHIL